MKKVYVCILAYKSDYLADVIKAVQNQTYKNISIEIKDDCSPENLEEIAAKFMNEDSRITYTRNKKNLGEWGSWIEAIESCECEYLVTLHDDDFISPLLVEKQIEILEKYPDVATVSGRFYVNESLENATDRSRLSSHKPDTYFKQGEYIEYFASSVINIFSHMAMMMRVKPIKTITDILRKVTLNDIGMILTLNSFYSIYVIGQELYSYRLHKNQVSRNLDLFSLIKPIEGFAYICDITCRNLGGEKSRKVIGWAQNHALQYTIIANENTVATQDKDISIYEKYFMLQLQFLKKKKGTGLTYKIWGSGDIGIRTKEIIDSVAPNFVFTGFIDKYFNGQLVGHDIIKLDEYSFSKEEYIFIGHIKNDEGLESWGKLVELGLEAPDDFMPGIGFPVLGLLVSNIVTI